MDLSILYGTSTTKAYSLRALTGGLLKTSDDARTSFQEYPYISSGLKNCPIGGVSPFPGNTCFMAGSLLCCTIINSSHKNWTRLFFFSRLFFQLSGFHMYPYLLRDIFTQFNFELQNLHLTRVSYARVALPKEGGGMTLSAYRMTKFMITTNEWWEYIE